MEIFDLKRFRGMQGLSQEEFAEKIKRSQATVSRIEKGTKDINDKFLDAVAKGFNIDLEVFKSYNQKNKLLDKPAGANHLSPPVHDESEFLIKYQQLLEDKAKLDEKYFDLLERYSTLENSLLKDNNAMLKKIDRNIQELLKSH